MSIHFAPVTTKTLLDERTQINLLGHIFTMASLIYAVCLPQEIFEWIDDEWKFGLQ